MIVRNNEGEPERVLLIETTGAAKSADLQKGLHVYLLPKKRTRIKDDAKESGEARKEIDEGSAPGDSVAPR